MLACAKYNIGKSIPAFSGRRGRVFFIDEIREADCFAIRFHKGDKQITCIHKVPDHNMNGGE